ncbi:hypothetical protein G1H11_23985 [Phytoactinopolyspora alkaliphila]|uniref:Uncharacterized protein n=1 Tax=Phytoactinopolyspora alkaliphila TaxID=1783498 RepID=A0A6N9YTS2_9ACTN|nr:DUF6069 family protein [Phytoactinopolyspora alkaliphila]NED98364.1 hypothetical protein [Phytoactinopolyspora alkaliphila]
MPVSIVRAHTSSDLGRRAARFAPVAAVCIVVATVANLGLYAIGKAADAALRIDPGAGEPNHVIVPGDVAWKTAVPLALGALMLALIARRSRRWTMIAIVAGVAGVIITIPFVLTGAHDLTTGLLLAGMHTIGGLTYAVIGMRARLNAKA